MGLGILLFEIGILIGLAGLFITMKKIGYAKLTKKFLILLLVVFLIEFLVQPLWTTSNLDNWAYIFKNASWVIFILWANLLFLSMIIVDEFGKIREEKKRFLLYVFSASLFRIVFEWILFRSRIRTPNQILANMFGGIIIKGLEMPFALIPVTVIIYIFVVVLYKYLSEFLFKNFTL